MSLCLFCKKDTGLGGTAFCNSLCTDVYAKMLEIRETLEIDSKKKQKAKEERDRMNREYFFNRRNYRYGKPKADWDL